jgi:signal transduction histidine kinase/CheY-like chemotaxis protein
LELTPKRIDSLINLSNKYFDAYRVQESLETVNTAIKLADKINDYYQLAHAYNIVGLNYERIKNYKEAERGYSKAIYFSNKANNDTLLCWVHNNMANVYDEGFGQLDKAIESYQQALTYARKIKDTFEILTPYINIGWTYLDNGQFEKALPYLDQANIFIEKAGDIEAQAQINYLYGRYYDHSGNSNKASQYFADAIVYGKAAEAHEDLSDIYLAYSQLESKKGNNLHAYQLLAKHIAVKEKVINQEKIAQAALAQAKYEVDEYKRDLEIAVRQAEIQEQLNEKGKTSFRIASITAILLLVLLFFTYRMMKSKKRLSQILEKKNTELIKAKKEAEALAKVKSEFISTVSHELRTPLYGVVGLTSILLENPNFSKKEHSIIKSLKFSGDYLLNLVNDVLQLSKIESKKVTLNKTSFKLRNLLENLKQSFEFQAEQNNNQIALEIDPKIPDNLSSDPVRLSQILINLVGNALKFTENDTVLMRVQHMGKTEKSTTLKVEVIDHGIGIPEERQKEIFDSFTQVDRDQGNTIGTGLGLTVVKKLVNLFGGDIKLLSEVDKGSTFSFTIDMEIDHSNALSIETLIEDNQKGTKKHVLIVEDNKINQMVTERILENGNFASDIAEDGQAGVQFIKDNKTKYDLVLMDMNMPKMNGLDATRAIRKFNSNIPIILLTASELDEIKENIYEAGINDYIIKPYDKYEFFQVLMRNINPS